MSIYLSANIYSAFWIGRGESGDSNNILTILKPTFSPILTINDLTKNANTNSKLPNAFIALMKEYRVKNC
uniref:Uncharacterized protein n=1 Tax=Rhizophagus irregularis (strain DAOM 181602 / DAOM 197198 / MUCL 43194) TaxID=747089 RepID=U9T7G1_RHIID